MPVAVVRPSSIAAAQQAVREGRPVGILMQRDPANEEPGPTDLHRMGVVANVLRYVTAPDGTHHLVAQGEQRFHVEEFVKEKPFITARVRRIEETTVQTSEIEAGFSTWLMHNKERFNLTCFYEEREVAGVGMVRAFG